MYRQYQALAERDGRRALLRSLATYRYYNMDQVVAQALTLYGRLIQDARGTPIAQSA